MEKKKSRGKRKGRIEGRSGGLKFLIHMRRACLFHHLSQIYSYLSNKAKPRLRRSFGEQGGREYWDFPRKVRAAFIQLLRYPFITEGKNITGITIILFLVDKRKLWDLYQKKKKRKLWDESSTCGWARPTTHKTRLIFRARRKKDLLNLRIRA